MAQAAKPSVVGGGQEYTLGRRKVDNGNSGQNVTVVFKDGVGYDSA